MSSTDDKTVITGIFIVITVAVLLGMGIGIYHDTRPEPCRDAILTLSPEYSVTQCPHHEHALTPMPSATTWLCRCPSK